MFYFYAFMAFNLTNRCKDVDDGQRFATGRSGRGIGVVGSTGYGYEYDSNLSTMYRNYQPGGGHYAKSAGGLDNFMYVEDDGDIYRDTRRRTDEENKQIRYFLSKKAG